VRCSYYNGTVLYFNISQILDTYWATYAGKSNGAHITLADCKEAEQKGDRSFLWSKDAILSSRSFASSASSPSSASRSESGNAGSDVNDVANGNAGVHVENSVFVLRSALAGSAGVVGGVRSTCGDDFDGQVVVLSWSDAG
jgi:hypothetical protein